MYGNNVYDNFLSNFKSDNEQCQNGKPQILSQRSEPNPELGNLLENHGGQSFSGGLYRLFTYDGAARWAAIVTQAFPSFESRICCFGYDWLGRVFALDKMRMSHNHPQVTLFDLGFNEALEIPCTLEQFHNEELVEYSEEALAKSFYVQWLKSGGQAPKVAECIGYRVPPMLGGADVIENLELSDMEIYWGLVGQINRKVGG